MLPKIWIYTVLGSLLFHVGRRLNAWQIGKLDTAISFLELGRWFTAKRYRYSRSGRFTSRSDLYAAIADGIQNEVVLYLEFGVWKGDSLRIWSSLLKNPKSSLHGFDSFEGLPEAWNHMPKGTFDVKGAIPYFDDPRVVLHKGWFDETLPNMTWPAHDRLVVNLDADLYSSTKYVLETLGGTTLRPGTILVFDEFYDRFNELKAFDEFIESTKMQFRFVGAVLSQACQFAFERVA